MYIPRKDPRKLQLCCQQFSVTQFQFQAMSGDVYQGEMSSYEIVGRAIEVAYAWLYVAQEFITVGPKGKEELFVRTWRHQPIDPKVTSQIKVFFDHFYRQKNKRRIKIELHDGEVAYFISKDNPVSLKHDPEDIRMISISHLLLPISSVHVLNAHLDKN